MTLVTAEVEKEAEKSECPKRPGLHQALPAWTLPTRVPAHQLLNPGLTESGENFAPEATLYGHEI
jgi:hypothetical protein